MMTSMDPLGSNKTQCFGIPEDEQLEPEIWWALVQMFSDFSGVFSGEPAVNLPGCINLFIRFGDASCPSQDADNQWQVSVSLSFLILMPFEGGATRIPRHTVDGWTPAFTDQLRLVVDPIIYKDFSTMLQVTTWDFFAKILVNNGINYHPNLTGGQWTPEVLNHPTVPLGPGKLFVDHRNRTRNQANSGARMANCAFWQRHGCLNAEFRLPIRKSFFFKEFWIMEICHEIDESWWWSWSWNWWWWWWWRWSWCIKIRFLDNACLNFPKAFFSMWGRHCRDGVGKTLAFLLPAIVHINAAASAGELPMFVSLSLRTNVLWGTTWVGKGRWAYCFSLGTYKRAGFADPGVFGWFLWFFLE